MNAETRLKNIEERITRAVCSVHGVICNGEVELRDKLRRQLGKKWDAVNFRWELLSQQDIEDMEYEASWASA
jgi:hypothetical protein